MPCPTRFRFCSCFDTVCIPLKVGAEVLSTASRVTTTTQAALEAADHFVNKAPARAKARPKPVHVNNTWGSVGTGGRTARRKGGRSATSLYADQPRGLHDGISQAANSISRRLSSAAHTIVAVPITEYRRVGAGGALKKVVKAVPVAILRPMIARRKPCLAF